MPAASVRQCVPADAAPLAAIVDEARGAGELRASSDPRGDWLVRQAVAEPGQAGVAVRDGALVGFVLPEAKALAR